MPEQNPFIATRKQHSLEAAEDYTELIADLIAEEGEARTCEIASRLGISHVSAVRTLKRLQKEGYLKTAPHKPVRLTCKGERLAAFSKKRHRILYAYLVALGVSKEKAAIDAEGMEHHLSEETLNAFERHLSVIVQT